MRNDVTITKDGPIAKVVFDRGERLNAFDQSLVDQLIEVARSFHSDHETRAIVVTGAANSFSSGADLKAALPGVPLSPVEERYQRQSGGRLCKAWEDLPQVTLAAISGLAVGAGCAFALAFDWRVMERDAYLLVPEVRLGWNLQWGAIPRLVSLVGPARAKRAALLCERMNAEGALDWGLVDRLADPGEAVETAMQWARIVAEFDPVPVRMIKEAVNAAAGESFHATSFADADQSTLSGIWAEQRNRGKAGAS